jgi:hypothetical protein
MLCSTILLTDGESSKILPLDCGKRLHGIAETSKHDDGAGVFDEKKYPTRSIILKSHGNCAKEVVVLKEILRTSLKKNLIVH